MYSSNVVHLVFFSCSSARLRSSSALSSASVHVVAPVLLAHLLLEVAAQDAQNPILAPRTFCRGRVVIELKM